MPPTGSDRDERWRVFIAFWLLGGVALVTIGILVFVTVAHAHRLGGVLVLFGIICLAIGLTVRRAEQRAN